MGGSSLIEGENLHKSVLDIWCCRTFPRKEKNFPLTTSLDLATDAFQEGITRILLQCKAGRR